MILGVPQTMRWFEQIFGCGLPAVFAQKLPCRLFHPVDALHQMHRDADDPPLIGNGPGDGLPDPPCRVIYWFVVV